MSLKWQLAFHRVSDQKEAEVTVFHYLASEVIYFSCLQHPNDYGGQAYSVWEGTAQGRE